MRQEITGTYAGRIDSILCCIAAHEKMMIEYLMTESSRLLFFVYLILIINVARVRGKQRHTSVVIARAAGISGLSKL